MANSYPLPIDHLPLGPIAPPEPPAGYPRLLVTVALAFIAFRARLLEQEKQALYADRREHLAHGQDLRAHKVDDQIARIQSELDRLGEDARLLREARG